jgi:signal transduction histidine kinase
MQDSLAQPARPAWQRWAVPRPSDWVPACLYVGVLLDYLVIHHATLLGWDTALVLGALAMLLALERWEHWRYGERAPMAMRLLLLALSAALIELVVQLSFEGIGAFLYLILPLRAWLSFGRGAGYLASAGVMTAYTAKTAIDSAVAVTPVEYLLSSCILFATAIAFVLTISHLADQDRRDRERAEGLLAQLERSHRELAAYAAQAAESAALAERNRVARDIHDGLGHYLTAINIQLEKALAFQDKDASEARRSVQASKGFAQEALADVRRSVGLLRARAEPFSLAAMLRDLAGASGSPAISLELTGDEAPFPLEVRMALYRAAQEGLTNIRRHAQARRASLSLQLGADRATLQIRDDGVGFDLGPTADAPADQAGGYGLRGLRERIALVGGSLQIASAPGHGTDLTVVAPRQPAGPPPEEARWASQ